MLRRVDKDYKLLGVDLRQPSEARLAQESECKERRRSCTLKFSQMGRFRTDLKVHCEDNHCSKCNRILGSGASCLDMCVRFGEVRK